MLLSVINHCASKKKRISSKLHFTAYLRILGNCVADQANDVHCNFPPDALMNTVSSYEAAYWLEQISYNFLICIYGQFGRTDSGG